MHLALSILEIVLDVFSHLDKKALSAIARTSRSFHEPALDLLWREQESLVPLFKCLPQDQWEEDKTFHRRVLYLRKSRSPSDLSLFRKNARRIISIKLPLMGEDWIRNLDYAPVAPLVPNLRSFLSATNGLENDTYALIAKCLGPTMQTITLYLNEMNSSLSLIPSVNKLCPSLKKLNFLYDESQTQVFNAVSELVCEMVDLESLSVGGLTTPAVTHIATFSNLRRLELRRLFRADNMLMLSEFSFPELSELTLAVQAVSCVGEFIELVRPKKLRKLSMTQWRRRSVLSGGWSECCQSVARYCSGTLEILDVQLNGDHGDIMARALVEPLFALRQLTELSVFFGPLSLNDDDLKQMALSWPRLRKLVIELEEHGEPDITLDGLVPLLEHCPDLCILSLALNAIFVRPRLYLLGRPGGGVSNHNIVSITVGCSIIDDATEVAAFLSDILPNLEEINWEDPEDDPYVNEDGNSLWEMVQELIPVFAAVRNQERVWSTRKHKAGESTMNRN